MNNSLPKTKANRSAWIDNVKGLLIICVVIGHFLDCSIGYHSENAKALFLFIYSFHMPLFIFISGLFCKHSIRTKEQLTEKLLLYGGLFLLLKILIYPFQKLNNPNIKFSLVSTDGVPWFLFAMCVFYSLAYMLKNTDKRKVLMISIIAALLAGYDNGIGDILVLSRCIVFFPFFVLGWICDLEELNVQLHKPVITIISPIILLGFLYICVRKLSDVYILRKFFTGRNCYAVILSDQESLGLVFRLVAYMITFIISLCILSIVSKKSIFFLRALGKNTLPIYFFHRPILFLLQYKNVYPYLQSHYAGNAKYIWISIALLLTIILAQPVFAIPFRKYQALIKQTASKLLRKH